LTVTIVLPECPPNAAVMVTVPGATPVTKPAETVTSPFEGVHIAWLVTFWLVWSL
jgi:hypothetical protein